MNYWWKYRSLNVVSKWSLGRFESFVGENKRFYHFRLLDGFFYVDLYWNKPLQKDGGVTSRTNHIICLVYAVIRSQDAIWAGAVVHTSFILNSSLIQWWIKEHFLNYFFFYSLKYNKRQFSNNLQSFDNWDAFCLSQLVAALSIIVQNHYDNLCL